MIVFCFETLQASLAVGYINALQLNDFAQNRDRPVLRGNKFNLFLSGAKRWGNRFHSLIYVSLQMDWSFEKPGWKTVVQKR